MSNDTWNNRWQEVHLCGQCTSPMPLARCVVCLDLFWCCLGYTQETPETAICWPCEREAPWHGIPECPIP